MHYHELLNGLVVYILNYIYQKNITKKINIHAYFSYLDDEVRNQYASIRISWGSSAKALSWQWWSMLIELVRVYVSLLLSDISHAHHDSEIIWSEGKPSIILFELYSRRVLSCFISFFFWCFTGVPGSLRSFHVL